MCFPFGPLVIVEYIIWRWRHTVERLLPLIVAPSLIVAFNHLCDCCRGPARHRERSFSSNSYQLFATFRVWLERCIFVQLQSLRLLINNIVLFCVVLLLVSFQLKVLTCSGFLVNLSLWNILNLFISIYYLFVKVLFSHIFFIYWIFFSYKVLNCLSIQELVMISRVMQ